MRVFYDHVWNDVFYPSILLYSYHNLLTIMILLVYYKLYIYIYIYKALLYVCNILYNVLM